MQKCPFKLKARLHEKSVIKYNYVVWPDNLGLARAKPQLRRLLTSNGIQTENLNNCGQKRQRPDRLLPEHRVLLSGVGDADAVVDVGQRVLQEGVGDDGAGVGEPEQRMVGEDCAESEKTSDEQCLLKKKILSD